ncbi:MAG TPA: hypothetical protein VHI71_05295 [Actinomycetota bacterium]|nr:hypothetical protein [Actinomycetota bacterium]
MGGFTLYETLRILVPGVMTTLVLDFGLRAGFGPGAFAADGGVAGFVGFLESTAGFTAFSLAVGLLLYMIDIAVKLRIFRGDPGRDRPLPSQTLEVMLAGSPRQEDAFSVYFALTDRYLPEEMRKRVYLNGSLFRIYVDLRIVAASVFVGVAAAARLAVAEGGDVRDATPSVAESLVAVALIGLIIIVGVYGIRQHAVNYRRKHADHPVPNFGQQLVSDLRGGLLPALLVGALGTAGAWWVVSERDAVRIAGVVVAGLQAFLWLGLEVGPPDPAPPTTVRDWIIGKIGAAGTTSSTRRSRGLSTTSRCLLPGWSPLHR